MPSKIQAITSGTNLDIQADVALNDSDKIFVVPANERWHIFAIYVTLTTTATVGNRRLVVDFRDDRLIDAQDETAYDNSPTAEGTFSGGTGYAGSDTITLSDGSTITVDNVTGGVVDEFTVASSASIGRVRSGDTLTQISTSGSGSGFTLSPESANIGNVFCRAVAGAAQAASATVDYTFGPGFPLQTSVTALANANDTLMCSMPATLLHRPSYSVRIYDEAAIAAAADDMTVRFLVDQGKAGETPI